MDGIRRAGGRLGRAAGQVGQAARGVVDRLPWPWEDRWEEGDPDDGDVLDPLAEGAHDAELAALDAAARDEAVAHLAVLDGGQPVVGDPAPLDGVAAEPDEGGDPGQLLAVLAALQPAPPLPRTAPFSAGLGGLLEQLRDHVDDGVLHDGRVGWVLERLASRLTVTVDDDGIEVVGLLRRRRTPWDRVDAITVTDRYALLRDHVIGGTVERAVALGPLPVPGLSWLLERVLLLLEQLLPRRWREAAADEGGTAVAGIGRRRGRDVELGGPLALVAFLSEGLTAVLLDEAERRGIPVAGA